MGHSMKEQIVRDLSQPLDIDRYRAAPRFSIRRFFELVKIAVLVALLLALVGLAIDAHAQTACPTDAVASNAARVCWRNATEMTDGAPIPADGPTSLAQTQVRYGACTATAAPSSTSLTTVPASIGFVLYEGLAPGVWCFSARHQLVDETWGPWSAWVRKTLTAPAPSKPKAPNVTVG